MGQFKNIQEIIASIQPIFEVEKINLSEALHRILQEDVIADINMPPFDKSAMDGYACKRADLDNELEVLELCEIPSCSPTRSNIWISENDSTSSSNISMNRS